MRTTSSVVPSHTCSLEGSFHQAVSVCPAVACITLMLPTAFLPL